MKKITLVLIGCIVVTAVWFLNIQSAANPSEDVVEVGGNSTAPHDVDYEDDYDLFGGFSDEDVTLMAAIVYYEAGCEDFLGKCYVVDSILNRLDDRRFPDSIEDILSAPKQYSTYSKAKDMDDSKIPIDCYGAVINEIHNRTNFQILYFSSEGYNGSNHLFQYGNHYFSS